MRIKRIAILIMISISILPIFATEDAVTHYMVGYVGNAASISVEAINEVLPFDMDSTVVAYNPSDSIVVGLKVGQYTLVSNNRDFSLTIKHTPLEYQGSQPLKEWYYNKIDYRLDVIIYTNDQRHVVNTYRSLLSNRGVNTVATADSELVLNGNDPVFSPLWDSNGPQFLSIVKQGLFVSLKDGGLVGMTVPDRNDDGTIKIDENSGDPVMIGITSIAESTEYITRWLLSGEYQSTITLTLVTGT